MQWDQNQLSLKLTGAFSVLLFLDPRANLNSYPGGLSPCFSDSAPGHPPLTPVGPLRVICQKMA